MTTRIRNRTAVLAITVLLGLNSTAMAQDDEPAAKSGKWFPWLSWNRSEGDVDLNRAVALSSSKPHGLKKLGQWFFRPSKTSGESATSYSAGDARVNGMTARTLGPGSFKVSPSRGWQPSASPFGNR